MREQEYQYQEQSAPSEQRMVNTDPREISAGPEERSSQGEDRHARLQVPPQKSRRPIWLVLALCLLALLVSLGIILLTGGLSITSVRQNLPTRTFSVPDASGSLIINVDGGNLHIHQGSSNQIVVQGDEYAYGLVSGFKSDPIQYQQQGNTVTMDIAAAWNVIGVSGMDITVTVPQNLNVTIHGGSTDADLSDLSGQVNINEDSGNLTLKHINGPVVLNTSSGDIQLSDEQGSISAHSSSGDITVNRANGPLDLSSSSGDVHVTQATGQAHVETSSGNITLQQVNLSGQDRLTSSSGDISVGGTLDPQGNYQVTTSSGDIDLQLPAEASFQLSTATDSGDVSNAFGSATTGNSPRATLILKTSSGDIHIHKG